MDLPKIYSRKLPTQSAKSNDFKNLLNRKFNPDEPDKIWTSDITYIKIGFKWHYLCVIDTFKKAYGSRNCPQCLMFHSDRGTPYTSAAFRKILNELNVVQFFSAKDCTFDNAVV